jgi:hypothetical protein
MRLLLAGALLAGLPMEVFERDAPFSAVETAGGRTLSARPVPGSPFKEYRVQGLAPYAPGPLCAFIFDWGTREGDGPGITHHALLVDGAAERVVYQQISQPIVSKRDFAFTSVHLPGDGGPCRVRFRITNALAPPRPEGFVRMERMWGEWVVESKPGGSQVTYTLFSDPGGSIPPFLVHGPARDATVGAFARMLTRAKAAALSAPP